MKKKIGLLGKNISYSISPYLHSYWFNYFDIKASYNILDIKEKDLNSQYLLNLKEKGYIGFNITIPYKQIILKLVDKNNNLVNKLNAINTVYINNNIFYSDNTDYFGFLVSLIINKNNSLDLTTIDKNSFLNLFNNKDNALVIGAGGASRAVIFTLIKSKINKIYVINRNKDKALQLKNNLNSNKIKIINDINEIKEEKAINLIVNCTPKENTTLYKYDYKTIVNKNCLFYDLTYNPLNSVFLLLAQENGFKTMNGLLMLILQGALSFKRWFNVFPPIENKLIKMLKNRVNNN